MSVLIAGTVAIDNIKTPTASEKNLLGGSASYAAIAAAFFTKHVDLVGIVGTDFPQEHLDLLKAKGIHLDGLEKTSGQTFTWTGEYAENMNERETLDVGLNVLERWTPRVHSAGQRATMVVLANMSPQNQLATLEQCPDADFVIADTMDLWIDVAKDDLLKVIPKVGLFVLNDGEAAMLTGTRNMLKAGEAILKLGAPNVAIKLGEHGAYLFGKDGEIFRGHTYPLDEVVDPTGAGDTFLGGAAGFLDNRGKTVPAFCDIRDAIVRGGVLASFTCEDFSTRKLESTEFVDFERRLDKLRGITCWS